MGGPADDGELWTGSVPADRDWLTTDDPIKAMQHAYCPQARRLMMPRIQYCRATVLVEPTHAFFLR